MWESQLSAQTLAAFDALPITRHCFSTAWVLALLNSEEPYLDSSYIGINWETRSSCVPCFTEPDLPQEHILVLRDES